MDIGSLLDKGNVNLPLTATYHKRILQFKRPSGTSRGVMTEKPTWYLMIRDASGLLGIGECSPLPGLSIDPLEDYESTLKQLCEDINHYPDWLGERLAAFPSIRFGLEVALLDLANGGSRVLFPSAFTAGQAGITINGLIWMGSPAYMQEQLQDKLAQGYHCIKLKIGAIDFGQELDLLRGIRQQFSKEQMELRVDANGAFAPNEAMYKLEQLAKLDIHSIEQPIRQGQWQAMANLCRDTPIPIALDEELIGIGGKERKQELLSIIQPQYIILKPSLIGGIVSSEEWINVANGLNISWWATSALESNIGLNAIAQWVFTQQNPMPQGLGTGQLYTNNIDCPLYLQGDQQYYQPHGKWVLDFV